MDADRLPAELREPALQHAMKELEMLTKSELCGNHIEVPLRRRHLTSLL